jgi:hypothetical protein
MLGEIDEDFLRCFSKIAAVSLGSLASTGASRLLAFARPGSDSTLSLLRPRISLSAFAMQLQLLVLTVSG